MVYCELYAGGKYDNDDGEAYEYSLGTNGLGACATQFASEYMTVTSYTKENKSSIRFEKGYPVTDLIVEEPVRRRTGTVVEWKPDLAVFTDINVPFVFFDETVKKQAVVNEGVTITLDFENEDGTHEKREYLYKRGIVDYMNEIISADGGYNPSEEAEEAEEQAAETDENDEADEADEAAEASTDDQAEENAARTYALTDSGLFQNRMPRQRPWRHERIQAENRDGFLFFQYTKPCGILPQFQLS